MSDEDLSSSESYLKKSNRTILFVGLGALFAFLTGIFFLMGEEETFKEDAKITIGDSNLDTDVSKTGANDVWHIERNGNEYLVPAIPDVIVSVDVEKEIAVLRPLKGIFDDEN